MELVVYYTQSILEMLDVTDIALACIYFILVVNNFHFSDLAYHTIITDLFGRNEKQLHEFFKYCRKIFENSVFKVVGAA